MRLMIMFDLPVETSEQRKAYRRFHKALVREGFFMMQYSNYVRVCPNKKSAEYMEKRISRIAPSEGQVQSLMVTEKQYQSMHFIVGKSSQDVTNSAERTIFI